MRKLFLDFLFGFLFFIWIFKQSGVTNFAWLYIWATENSEWDGAIWQTCWCFSNHEILYSIALNHFISTPSLFSSVCVFLSFFLSPHFPALLIIASVCARLYLILILLILLLVLALHELCCFPKTHQIGVRIWFPTQKQTIFYPEPLLMLMTCWGGLTATLVPVLIYADINDNCDVRKWNTDFL